MDNPVDKSLVSADKSSNKLVDNLWKMTKDFAGINEDYFYQYFCDKQKGFAIKIKKAKMKQLKSDIGHQTSTNK